MPSPSGSTHICTLEGSDVIGVSSWRWNRRTSSRATGRHAAIRLSKKEPRARRTRHGALKPQALPVHPWSKRYGYRRHRLDGAQIFSGRFAGSTVCDNLEGNLLSLIEGAHAGTFDRADMNEDILAAVLRLNEAKAFLAVKPLYSSRIHGSFSFSYACILVAP